MSDWKYSSLNLKNNSNWNTGSEGHISGKVSNRPNQGWSTTADVEVFNVGIDVGIEMLKAEKEYGNGLGKLTLKGPSVGVDVGAKSSVKHQGLSAMAELSAVKAEATLGPFYVSAGLNANTGVKMGRGGVQAGFLGFGLTLGIGGRWTIDTPFGSAGVSGGASGGASGVAVAQHEQNRVTTRDRSHELVEIYK